jgi:hypothetical protein
MSRLDSVIRRLEAQRACLNRAAELIRPVDGAVLELGLGNGRTYDHLRDLFPGRDIYVFERHVAAHPECIPPDDRLFLGEAREAIPRAAGKLGASAALIHTDLGTGDHAANTAMGKWLGPALDALAAPGSYVLANQPLGVARWQRLPEPPGVPAERYFLYRVG